MQSGLEDLSRTAQYIELIIIATLALLFKVTLCGGTAHTTARCGVS